MKLIYCPHCEDIVKLRHYRTTCECGRSYGAYLDNLYAVYAGDAIPLGIDNLSIAAAIEARPASGRGKHFTTFVIPKECPTFTKTNAPISPGPRDPKCRSALLTLLKSEHSGFSGVIGREGAILVRNRFARRLGPRRFGPGERYVVFELTATGKQVCDDLGLTAK